MEVLNLAFKRDWPLKVGRNCLTLLVPCQEVADELLDSKLRAFEVSALRLQKKLSIRWGDRPTQQYLFNPRRGMMPRPIIAVPGIELSSFKLSLPLLRVFEEFLEAPEIKGGLIRLSDERQLALTEASAALVVNSSLTEAVTRRRAEYWHPEDLLEMQRIMRQGATENLVEGKGGLEFEFTWRGVSKDRSSWRKFTNRYRTILDDFGTAYQVSFNLGVEAIAPPAGVSI